MGNKIRQRLLIGLEGKTHPVNVEVYDDDQTVCLRGSNEADFAPDDFIVLSKDQVIALRQYLTKVLTDWNG